MLEEIFYMKCFFSVHLNGMNRKKEKWVTLQKNLKRILTSFWDSDGISKNFLSFFEEHEQLSNN